MCKAQPALHLRLPHCTLTSIGLCISSRNCPCPSLTDEESCQTSHFHTLATVAEPDEMSSEASHQPPFPSLAIARSIALFATHPTLPHGSGWDVRGGFWPFPICSTTTEMVVLNSLNTSGDSGLGYLTVEGVPAAC